MIAVVALLLTCAPVPPPQPPPARLTPALIHGEWRATYQNWYGWMDFQDDGTWLATKLGPDGVRYADMHGTWYIDSRYHLVVRHGKGTYRWVYKVDLKRWPRVRAVETIDGKEYGYELWRESD